MWSLRRRGPEHHSTKCSLWGGQSTRGCYPAPAITGIRNTSCSGNSYDLASSTSISKLKRRKTGLE
eukprot:2049310-Rhodomonas_salina.2